MVSDVTKKENGDKCQVNHVINATPIFVSFKRHHFVVVWLFNILVLRNLQQSALTKFQCAAA